MKIKLMVLITGTLLGVAYLVGCGGGGNNNNNNGNCGAGYTWNGSTCVYGATAYGQGNCQAQPGTIWAQQANACVQVCSLGGSGQQGGIINGQCQYIPSNCGQTGYGQTGYQGGYGGYQSGYQNGYQNSGFSGGQGCNGFQGGGYGQGGGQYGPYPQQYPYYYSPYGGSSIYWNLNFH
jgi:hypothetical protein